MFGHFPWHGLQEMTLCNKGMFFCTLDPGVMNSNKGIRQRDDFVQVLLLPLRFPEVYHLSVKWEYPLLSTHYN